jgi:microcompartment protein CcmK/EutM
MFCSGCGKKNAVKAKFCSGCGGKLVTAEDESPQQHKKELESTRDDLVEKVKTMQAEESIHKLEEGKEKVYYRGEGELLVRTTKHHGAGRKVASFVAGAGVGYLIAGRDSKRTTKAKGSIVVTNKAVYCAGNKFEFDNILAMTKKGTFQKKIHLTLDKSVGAGGRGEGDKIAGGNRISVEIEISTKDIDGLFKGLENARMSGVEF